MMSIRRFVRIPARLFLVAILIGVVSGSRCQGAIFPVTSTADNGPNTLRLAMATANLVPGRDTIVFAIPGAGPQIINVLSQLPPLTDLAGLLIDGYTQPGSTPGANPPFTAVIRVVLNGQNAGLAHGIYITSPNNTIRGLCVMNFQQDGIRIEATVPGTFANRIEACFIGTDPVGGTGQSNGWNLARPWAGVNILADPMILGQAYFNTVWRNLISDNYAIGVSISSCPPADVFDNTVDSNLIGTTVSGMTKLGNAVDGVYIGEGAHHNHIIRNVIAGNDTDGVCIVGYTDNAVSWFTHHNDVRNNLIGLAADGVTPLSNGRDGVIIGIYGAVWLLGFAPDNTVATNSIACNGRNGVSVWEHQKTTINTDNNTISKNSIHRNAALGIDLTIDGVTPNDAGDADARGNQELNCPVITAATSAGGLDTVRGTLSIDTSPLQAVVEVFKAFPCAAGSGQGIAYLGSATPDAAGNWTASFTGLLAPGDQITATATDLAGNTSEFSVTVPVNPAAISAPASLQFGTVLVSQSADRTLLIANTGAAPLLISSVTVGAGPFAILAGPGASIPAGGVDSCRLRFTPLAAGPASATLTITSNAANAPTLGVALQGAGTSNAPVIVPDAAQLNFGSLLPGGSSSRVLRIANNGNAPLNLQAQWTGGPDSLLFPITQPCGTPIPPGGLDSMDITFTPASIGIKDAKIYIASDDPVTPVASVVLRGICLGTLPAIGVQPTTVGFGVQVPGGVTERRVLVMNTGNAQLILTSQALAGADTAQFRIARTAGPTIAVGGVDTLILRFTPSAAGPYSAYAAIASNAINTPVLLIPLSGTCADSMAVLAVTPPSLSFGTLLLGRNAVRTLLVGNNGTASLRITAQSVSGADSALFSILRPCATLLPPGKSDSIVLRYAPAAPAAASAQLGIASDDPNQPSLQIPLSGLCVASMAAIAVDPAAVNFGSLLPGDTLLRSVRVTNTGNAALSVTAQGIGGADSALFTIVRACRAGLGAGQADTMLLRFAPSASGAKTAQLGIASNDPNRPLVTVPLGGICLDSLPRLLVVPQALSFGPLLPGETLTGDVMLSNTGNAWLHISAQRITGTDSALFAIIRAGRGALPPGASDTMRLRYAPLATGTASAALRIASNDPNGPETTASLQGLCVSKLPRIAISTTLLDFGTVQQGQSRSDSVMITNTGTDTLHILHQAIGGSSAPDFVILRSCASQLPPGGSDFIIIRYLPMAIGASVAMLDVTCDDPRTPSSTIVLIGRCTGQQQPCLSLGLGTQLDFGVTATGVAVDRVVAVTNTCAVPVQVHSLAITGMDSTDFLILRPCAALLQPGTTDSIALRFLPQRMGTKWASLRLVSSDTVRPMLYLGLYGVAVGSPVPNIVVRPTMIDFGQVAPGDHRDSAVIVSNTGEAPLLIAAQSITGRDAADFSILQQAGSTVQAHDSTRLILRHAPISFGAKTAALQLQTNDTGRPVVDIPLESTVVSVQHPAAAPDRFALRGPWPNPFSGSTSIVVDMPRSGVLHLRVYDPLGRCVRTLADIVAEAGSSMHVWDGRDDAGYAVQDGMYLVVGEANGNPARISALLLLLR